MSQLSHEEQGFLRHYIILSLARQALEKDLFQIEQTTLKLHTPFLELTRSILDLMGKEMATIKRDMAQYQMNVEKPKIDGLFSEYHYRFRGYEGTTRILNVHLKHQVTEYMMRYFTLTGNRH